MSRDHRDRRMAQRIAEKTKVYLVLTILLLISIALLLVFRIGEALWPAWMVAYRTQLIGFDLLGVLTVICLFPIIVEANSKPRHLSGPGHNPEQGPGSPFS